MKVESATLRTTLRGHEASVNAAAFSPDGLLLITSAGGDASAPGRRGKIGETLVWDIARQKLAVALVWHRQPVLAVAVSPDGETLATGSRDQTVAIWNIGRGLWDAVIGVCERSLRGHSGAVTALAFSPDGGLLATGDDDESIRLWETRDWRQVASFAAPQRAPCQLAFSPDGRQLACACRSRAPVVVWDVARRSDAFELRLPRGERFEGRGLAYSHDGQKLAVLSADEIRVWDVSSCQVLTQFNARGSEVIAYSPRGDWLATGGWDAGTHAAVRFFNAGTGAVRAHLQGHKLPVTAIAFSPAGNLLASAGRDMLVNVWEFD
ncbi:MAG TPA: WD40 repeat domain-containing protein [Pirellulales bacterium]|nr:WD40 repeat domain-containing protein [Pirellulales bacterium]